MYSERDHAVRQPRSFLAVTDEFCQQNARYGGKVVVCFSPWVPARIVHEGGAGMIEKTRGIKHSYVKLLSMARISVVLFDFAKDPASRLERSPDLLSRLSRNIRGNRKARFRTADRLKGRVPDVIFRAIHGLAFMHHAL